MIKYKLTMRGKIVLTLLCTLAVLCTFYGISAWQNRTSPLDNNASIEVIDQKPPEVKPPTPPVEKEDAIEQLKVHVFFEPDKADISKEYHEGLDVFSNTALKQSNVKIQIEGNCALVLPDTEHQKQLNYSFSVRRAQAVANYLEARGVDPNRFVIIGNGSNKPLKDNSTLENRKQNRRVDVFFKTE